jgi:4-hydroxy-3-methylbut-2-enyl diphosphate reductase
MQTPPTLEIVLVRPRGFCAGVERAIAIVEKALEKWGAPVYVKHAIVHNRHVVERLERLGAVFIEDLALVPRGGRVIFSAHGVAPEAHREALEAGLSALDATCPLVTKVHMEARRFAREQRTIFLIGHREHVEVIGTRGEAPERTVVVGTAAEAETVRPADPERVAFLTQTTLSLDDTREIVDVLRRRFPALAGPGKDDICYATQNRQQAVQALAQRAEVILVIGSAHSSNSRRLVEVAQASGVPAHLVESFRDVQAEWLAGVRRIGVSAGASAPEDVVQELVSHLARHGNARVIEHEVTPERVSFPLPHALAE